MKPEFKSFNLSFFTGEMINKILRKAYQEMMKGVHSANVINYDFAFGVAVEPGTINRKFFYDKSGQVIKKLSFDNDGELEMKETYTFTNDGKVLTGHFITSNSVQHDQYTYDKTGIVEYEFFNPEWPSSKREVYQTDRAGRKIRKTTYGLLNFVELVTEYIYDGNSKRYTFRQMTDPDGKLMTTFYYHYDKDGNLSGLYTFNLFSDEITKLVKKEGWELESETRSIWQRDNKGQLTQYVKDEKAKKFQLAFQLEGQSAPENGRVVTAKTSYEFKKHGNKSYLIQATEWLPRFDEELKKRKEYQYFDGEGKLIKFN